MTRRLYITTRKVLVTGIEIWENAKIIGSVVVLDNNDNGRQYADGEGREWHRTWAEAQARAAFLQRRAIATAQRRLQKLKALPFMKNAAAT